MSDYFDYVKLHGVESIAWNNIGQYFRGTCLCGWETAPAPLVAQIGEEFDMHFREMKS